MAEQSGGEILVLVPAKSIMDGDLKVHFVGAGHEVFDNFLLALVYFSPARSTPAAHPGKPSRDDIHPDFV